MLVLNLFEGKRIRLLLPDGRAVWLKSVRHDHLSTRLGIDAPNDIVIEREEIIGRPAAVDREEAPGMGT